MTRSLWISLPVAAALFLVAVSLRGAAGQGETVVFEEKFDKKLSDGWAWLRELPGAWKVGNGELVLDVQPDYLHPFGKNARNILLRELPADMGPNWAVELKLESDPKVQYEHAGVLVFWDEDNLVGLYREFLDGKPALQMCTVRKNAAHCVPVRQDIKPVWIRVAVNGDEVTTQYRASDKDAWQTVGTTKRVLPGIPRCGLSSGGAPKDAHRQAKFSHFQIVKLVEG